MRTNVPGGIHVVASIEEEHVIVGPLGHGEHPENLLARGGFRAEEPVRADLSDEGSLELAFRVSRASGIRERLDDVLRDPDIGPDDVGELHQRVAAYAVVTSERGVLLTQFNEQTHVAGEWGLPGGGLDAGESPVGGVLREVWEETGQRVDLGRLVTIQSQHWVGRAPNGVIEDFHAVRIVYLAVCPDPHDIVIHDEGGTTSDARWVRFEELGDYGLTRAWRRLEALSRLASEGSHPGP
ncbi:MAG TPA: NUDIX domain-containing protein [Dermatophilaceae bacterium]|nr:NUDIX domain-containing protein [Dermatophilaceae bacterium]